MDLSTGRALAINTAGVAVGTDEGSAVFWRKGVKGGLAPAEPDEPLYYLAAGINSSGMVVGVVNSEVGTFPEVWQIK